MQKIRKNAKNEKIEKTFHSERNTFREEHVKMTDSYVALDLETTGLEPKKEKITEIAALKV